MLALKPKVWTVHPFSRPFHLLKTLLNIQLLFLSIFRIYILSNASPRSHSRGDICSGHIHFAIFPHTPIHSPLSSFTLQIIFFSLHSVNNIISFDVGVPRSFPYVKFTQPLFKLCFFRNHPFIAPIITAEPFISIQST